MQLEILIFTNIYFLILFLSKFMNKTLRIFEILTKPNLLEEVLKEEILESDFEQHEVKLAVLFRRYYGNYSLSTEEEELPLEAMIQKIVKTKRKERFEKDKYWSIWKEDGLFFGFMEGFFHAQEGKNQLCKIRGKKIDNDFLIDKTRQWNLKNEFGIESQSDYFKSPDIFAFRFQTLEEFRVFLRIHKIERMVPKSIDVPKGMHLNIYQSAIAISKDTKLKKIFREGLVNSENGEIDKSFFDISAKLTKTGLYTILSSFRGYGPKISKMVMNLVFDVPIIAVDRRVLRSAIMLSLVELKDEYYEKIKNKFEMQSAGKKELADKISAISDLYALSNTETVLNEMFANSAFLSEADYLLFMYNGGDGWNFHEDVKKLDAAGEMCRLGKCCFDETGACLLRRKVEYAENKSGGNVLRNDL